MAKPWWFPEIAGADYFARLRKDYPWDAQDHSDEELRDQYAGGHKYVTL